MHMVDNTAKQSQNKKATLFVSIIDTDKVIHNKAGIYHAALETFIELATL